MLHFNDEGELVDFVSDDRLASVRARIDVARRHLEKLHATLDGFHDSRPHIIAVHEDADTQTRTFAVDRVGEVPAEISLVSAETIGVLRSALDLLVNQLSVGGAVTGGGQTVRYPTLRERGRVRGGA